ncbi:c-type cytochrome biogenesis protein CcmI [Salinisphaera sp. PC39]|uniref:c-type cytochrome biogenesis protein CcmI n=1 Tax=Salinisphaera sp. PC39 TaxID=1304156 RepID=UPI0033405A63
MEPLFWTLAALMILAALAIVAIPLWRHGQPSDADDGVSSEQADVTLYRRRREELDREREAGLLSAEEHRVALVELDRQLLADTEDADATAPRSGRRPAARWLPMAAAAVAIPLIAVPLYLEVGGGPGAADNAGSPQQPPDIQAMVSRLEDRLAENPDNGEGWLMLGRSYAAMGQPGKAVRALSRAREQLGDDPEVLVEYAGALAATREPMSFSGRPAELLERALDQDPGNPRALWLAGMANIERGDYGTAIDRWERLLGQLPPEGEDADVVRRNLERARERLGVAPAAAQASTAPATAEAETPAASLRVRVALAPELRERAAPDDTVFIFARAVNGPPMPLAVVKRRVRDLPATVTLDDDDSMMPGRGISGHEKVTVVARVSRSGDARASAGDFESAEHTASLDSDGPLDVTIDSVVR